MRPSKTTICIGLPTSVDEALAIDRRTGTTFWADAINKETDRTFDFQVSKLDVDKKAHLMNAIVWEGIAKNVNALVRSEGLG